MPLAQTRASVVHVVRRLPPSESASNNPGSRPGDHHIGLVDTTPRKVRARIGILVLKCIDMSTREVLQRREYHIIDVLVSETEARRNQERVVQLQEASQAIHERAVRLLTRFVVLPQGREDHLAGIPRGSPDYSGVPALLHAAPRHRTVHLPQTSPVASRCRVGMPKTVRVKERLESTNEAVKKPAPVRPQAPARGECHS